MTTYRNRLSTAISNNPDTDGALDIGLAPPGYRTFRAEDDGLSFNVAIVDGHNWEIRTGCVYSNNGPSLSRGTLEDSSTGGAIKLTSSAIVTLAMTAADGAKLDSVAPGATAYAHPDQHAPGIIAQDADNRLVTDLEKAEWSAKQPAGTYATGTGSAEGVNTGDQVIPTSLPASDVSAWAKEPVKPAYTAAEVGLGNVDNTSDADKPVSTAQQAALDDKEAIGAASAAVAAHAGAADPHPQYTTPAEAAAAAPVQSVAGKTGAVVPTKADVGLGNVDNTSDAAKPVSTATQTALNSKVSAASGVASSLTLNGGYAEQVYALTSAALNPANGSIQTTALSANATFTDSLLTGQSMILGIEDGAAFSATWPAITWTTSPATAPTLPTSGYLWVVLWKVGATLYGKY